MPINECEHGEILAQAVFVFELLTECLETCQQRDITFPHKREHFLPAHNNLDALRKQPFAYAIGTTLSDTNTCV